MATNGHGMGSIHQAGMEIGDAFQNAVRGNPAVAEIFRVDSGGLYLGVKKIEKLMKSPLEKT